MNQKIVAAALLATIIVVAIALWFSLYRGDAVDPASDVQITAFSVDPEGWTDPPDSWAACLFNITIEN
jgi:hypothetical protein